MVQHVLSFARSRHTRRPQLPCCPRVYSKPEGVLEVPPLHPEPAETEEVRKVRSIPGHAHGHAHIRRRARGGWVRPAQSVAEARVRHARHSMLAAAAAVVAFRSSVLGEAFRRHPMCYDGIDYTTDRAAAGLITLKAPKRPPFPRFG